MDAGGLDRIRAAGVVADVRARDTHGAVAASEALAAGGITAIEIAFTTGGVDLGNVADWFAAGAFAVGAAGELCSRDLIEDGRFGEITARAERFVAAAPAAPR